MNLNGIHAKSVIIRENNDTLITFEHEKIIIVDKDDIVEFFKIYDEMKQKYNVIIDLRMTHIIWYFIAYHGNEVLIYDPNKCKVLTLYEYLPQHYFISGYELPIRKLKIFFKTMLILSYYFSHIGIAWNVNIVIEDLKNIHDTLDHRIMLGILLNIVGIRKTEKYEYKKIEDVVNLMKSIFSEEFRAGEHLKLKSTATNYNECDFYCALLALRDMDHII